MSSSNVISRHQEDNVKITQNLLIDKHNNGNQRQQSLDDPEIDQNDSSFPHKEITKMSANYN